MKTLNKNLSILLKTTGITALAASALWIANASPSHMYANVPATAIPSATSAQEEFVGVKSAFNALMQAGDKSAAYAKVDQFCRQNPDFVEAVTFYREECESRGDLVQIENYFGTVDHPTMAWYGRAHKIRYMMRVGQPISEEQVEDLRDFVFRSYCVSMPVPTRFWANESTRELLCLDLSRLGLKALKSKDASRLNVSKALLEKATTLFEGHPITTACKAHLVLQESLESSTASASAYDLNQNDRLVSLVRQAFVQAGTDETWMLSVKSLTKPFNLKEFQDSVPDNLSAEERDAALKLQIKREMDIEKKRAEVFRNFTKREADRQRAKVRERRAAQTISSPSE